MYRYISFIYPLTCEAVLGLGEELHGLSAEAQRHTQSLAAVFYELDLCKPTWGMFMAFLLLPFVQIRTLNNVSALRCVDFFPMGGEFGIKM